MEGRQANSHRRWRQLGCAPSLGRTLSRTGVQSGESKQRGVWATRVLSVVDLLWATIVGVSVTLRLLFSVQLSNASGMGPLAGSCFVTTVTLLISSALLAPFASWRSIPRRRGPWLAGLCTLPAFALVAAASVLSLGIVQMVLRLATLSAAVSLDVCAGRSDQGLRRRILGTVVVFMGVVVGIWSSAGGGSASVSILGKTACVGATFLAGACYVLQARLMARPDTDERAACIDALVCQLTNAAAQVPILAACIFAGGGRCSAGFGSELNSVPLWMFTGFQGAFYLRSLQVLPARLGYATTFALSLWGQLATAALLDAVLQSDGAASLERVLGLSLVVVGAVISATGGTGMPKDSAEGKATEVSE